jgi:hypothetical protein
VPGDQRNIGFSGTYISQGGGVAVVVATGRNTAFGQIADMVKAAESTSTPLQRKMSEFVRSLIVAILAVGAFNFLYGLYLGYEMSYSFLGAVSLVVAAIPEMLPALVTSILALSGVVMARRKALIRKLPAAETLGATSVICSDKTGTLTENRMTVTRISAGGLVYRVTGEGNALEGRFVLDAPVSGPRQPALQAACCGGLSLQQRPGARRRCARRPDGDCPARGGDQGGLMSRRRAAPAGDAFRFVREVHGRAGRGGRRTHDLRQGRAGGGPGHVQHAAQRGGLDVGGARSRCGAGARRRVCRRCPAHPGFCPPQRGRRVTRTCGRGSRASTLLPRPRRA